MRKRVAIILITLLVIGVSCSIQKRVYLPGYHLTWKNNISSLENKNTDKNDLVYADIVNNDLATNDESSIDIFKDVKTNENCKSVQKLNTKSFVIKNNSQNKKNKNEECDLIILNNGDDISVKVVELTSTEIKYKKCDNINGPIYSIQKSEVFTIRYSNGSKEIIKSSSNNKLENTTNDKSNSNRYSNDSKEIIKSSSNNNLENQTSSSSNLNSDKSQIVALLLCLFIGVIGVHRFYLGYPEAGVLMLLTLGGCGIWALIDFIRILSGTLKPKGNEYKTKL
jgi:TM2 domain-containing membrane protein YozV